MTDTLLILVIDDNDGDCRLIQELLRRVRSPECQVVHEHTLADGVKRIALQPPDVVLLDLGLRETNGLDTLSAWLQGGCPAPVVVLTGLDDDETARQAVRMGAQDYLIKHDMSAQELLRAIRYALERHQFTSRMVDLERLESLGRLAGAVAHDYNNLLTAILCNTDLAMAEAAPASSLMHYLSEIDKAGQHAARIAASMLTFSGRGFHQFTELDLAGLLREIRPALQTLAVNRVEMVWNIDTLGLIVRVDPAQIQQALVNLVANAVEASPEENARLVISLRRERPDESKRRQAFPQALPDAEYAVIAVQDNGHGMDAATLAKVFDPFFTTRFTGRGLGLAAVLGIVRAHKGGIYAESQPRDGALFELLLPVMSSL